MKFKTRRSFSASINFKKGPYRFYLGLLVGTFTAFTTYAFLVCLREGVRILNFAGPEYFWYFSTAELYFSSYVLAFFALQFAQLQCLQIWWQKPNLSPRKRYNYSLLAHDFKLNYWYYFYWFFALGFYYAFFMAWTFRGGFYYTELYKNYAALWVLALLVLQVNSFATYRRIMHSKVWRPFLISSIITFGLAALLAFWQPAKAERIQTLNAQKDLFKNSGFQLPGSPLRSKKPIHTRERVDVYYNLTNEIVYRYKAKTYTSSKAIAQDLNANFKPQNWFIPTLVLQADSRYSLYELATFLDQLTPAMYQRAYFNIASVNPKLPPVLDKHYQRFNAFTLVKAWRNKTEQNPDATKLKFDFTNYASSALSAKAKLQELSKIFYHKIDQAPNYPYLQLELDSTVTLGDYLLVKSAFYLAVKQKRQNYAKNHFFKDLEALNEEDKETCERLYPVRLKPIFIR